MSYSNTRGAVQQYTQVRAHSSVEGVTPHRLIQLLLEGALEKISTAKGYMLRDDVAGKVTHIEWALSIIEGLQVSLDMEKGGDIAENLDKLYDYMQRQLILANTENNPELLDEVTKLLIDIKEGWDGIPEDVRRMPVEEPQKQTQPEK